MKKIVISIALVIIALVGVAWGGSSVYPIEDTFTGSSSGIALSPVVGNATAGDTTIVNTSTSETVKITRVDFKPTINQTGKTNIMLGASVVYSISNALADNVYGFNVLPSYLSGAIGDDLIINTPGTICYNIYYIKE